MIVLETSSMRHTFRQCKHTELTTPKHVLCITAKKLTPNDVDELVFGKMVVSYLNMSCSQAVQTFIS